MISTRLCASFVVLNLLLLLLVDTTSEIEKMSDHPRQRESAEVKKMPTGNEKSDRDDHPQKIASAEVKKKTGNVKSSRDDDSSAFYGMPGFFLYNMPGGFFGGTSSTHGEVNNLQIFFISAGTLIFQILL